ncbi:DUF2235 domain-containing protein [Xenorhabdus szentirmaii]|nr:DUF2235 domain-containing protein [Xenorhabdus szentirmaii]
MPPHPSNIARLYHACSPQNERANDRGFHSYYIPGVGTPFPEINTMDYYSSGLTFAVGGEDRINWGLIQICDALNYSITGDHLQNTVMRKAVEAMNTSNSSRKLEGTAGIFGAINSIPANQQATRKKYLEAINNQEPRTTEMVRLHEIEKLLKPLK